MTKIKCTDIHTQHLLTRIMSWKSLISKQEEKRSYSMWEVRERETEKERQDKVILANRDNFLSPEQLEFVFKTVGKDKWQPSLSPYQFGPQLFGGATAKLMWVGCSCWGKLIAGQEATSRLARMLLWGRKRRRIWNQLHVESTLRTPCTQI